LVPETTIGASYGDAFLAGLAAGIVKRADLEQWVRTGTTVRPNPTLKGLYDEYFTDFVQLYEHTRDIAHRLSARSGR
jgi:xylulokinase